jgi:8-oxo-dGTP pyrophosphatase MutT (NUDIX family)
MLSDGKYVVLFNMFALDGSLTGQQKIGEFSVRSNSITNTEGKMKTMLPIGPISPATEIRITLGLNNGYMEVRHTQSFQPKPLAKSETLTIDKGPFAKFLRAIENKLAHGMRNITINRTFWVPGLAGSSLDRRTVYIDSRLPETFQGVKTDKYIVIHEVVEAILMDDMGFDYSYAHDIALAAENYAVARDGLDPKEYEKHMWSYIHMIGTGTAVPKSKRPPDLDPDRITHDRSIKDIMRHALRKSDKTAKPGVASIAVRDSKSNSILMGKRNDNGKFTTPGGHLNPGESPLNGAKRELFEETGITAKSLKFLGKRDVTTPEGKDLTIYSFLLDGKYSTETEQDPDEEVQKWELFDTKEIKEMDKNNKLHTPLKGNVTLSLLLSQKLLKSDKIGEDNEKPTGDFYEQMRDDILAHAYDKNYKGNYSAEEIKRFIKTSFEKRDARAEEYIIRHPNFTPEHTQMYLDHPEMSNEFPAGSPTAITYPSQLPEYQLFRHGKFSDAQVQRVLDENKKYQKSNKLKGSRLQQVSMYHLPSNENLSTTAVNNMADFINNPENDSQSTNARNKMLLSAHPDISPENIDKIVKHTTDSDVLKRVIDHPGVSKQAADYIEKNTNSDYIRKAAQDAKKKHGITNDTSVHVIHGTNKLREMRDFIDSKGGTMSGKELAAAGMSLDSMGLAKLKGPKGEVTSQVIQDHIDSLPSNHYHYSTTQYGFNPDVEDYEDPGHPDYEKYQDAERTDKDDYAESEQRHTIEPSKVFQLNITPEKISELKNKGVWDTFSNMNHSSRKSGHPVGPHTGAGWLRYTTGKDGHFIDEIQSDIGSSLVKKITSLSQKGVDEGKITPEKHKQNIADAEETYPEAHHKIINEVVFNGKDPSEVIHEAFLQHLRDKGETNTPVSIWAPKGKASVSLQDKEANIPGHMIKTYEQTPKKMGYHPSEYGKTPAAQDVTTKKKELTQNNPKHLGKPTMSSVLRKSDIGNKIGDIHQDGKHVWAKHPTDKCRMGKPIEVWDATPEHKTHVDSLINEKKQAYIDSFPEEHRKLVGAFINRVMVHPARHVRMGWDNNKPAVRARHIKSLVFGDSGQSLKVDKDGKSLTFKIHQRHGQSPMPESEWNYDPMNGIKHAKLG